ncbi:MAG: FkbM family methyltransferase [Methylobacter sp.]
MLIKKFIYQIWQVLNKSIWRLCGGRQEKAMGLSLNLHPDTVWPGRRGLCLPNGDCRSKIVAYADYVQAHAVCNAIGSIPNPVIIDVGAHHGEYAVLLGGLIKHSNRGGVLLAIEPDASNITILKENVQRNNLQDIVNVVECAVSDFAGEMDFVSQGTQGHLLPENREGKGGVSCKIKVETLHDIICCFNLIKVDLLMIDVEGAELPVLRGIPWEIMKPSMILCELHPYNWPIFGYTGTEMAEFLKEHNYRCLDMYLHEHSHFDSPHYVGPCLFLSR